jgi:hypothetical protein
MESGLGTVKCGVEEVGREASTSGVCTRRAEAESAGVRLRYAIVGTKG